MTERGQLDPWTVLHDNEFSWDDVNAIAAILSHYDFEIIPTAGVRPAPDAALLRKMLPGIDALLVIDSADAGRVIAGRPDVWVVLAAYLRAALALADREADARAEEQGGWPS